MSSSPTSSVCHEEATERLYKTLEENGVKNGKLTPHLFKFTGRGMQATEDITDGEVIVEIPAIMLISTKTSAVEECAQLFGLTTPSSEHQLLALFLALNRGTSGPYESYINSIPSRFDTVAALLEPSLFEHLPPVVKAHSGRQMKQLRDEFLGATGRCTDCSKTALSSERWDTRCGVCRSTPQLDFDDWVWAWFAVNTRCITLIDWKTKRVRPGQPKIALAPVLDLLNHSQHAKIETGFDRTTLSYKIRTNVPYSAGTQVFINYGAHDNSFLLAEYGFVLPDNPYNYTNVDRFIDLIKIPGETRLSRANAEQVLANSALPTEHILDQHQGASPRLTTALRLRVLSASFPREIIDAKTLAKCWDSLSDRLEHVERNKRPRCANGGHFVGKCHHDCQRIGIDITYPSLKQRRHISDEVDANRYIQVACRW
ncbi:hypothetical protein DFS34DRAFT_261216 [Phlyctochytrium arcticum]|nr:hypothetical protein DFS34DRAFT_261216 [Phlyctochytrium arcticum]